MANVWRHLTWNNDDLSTAMPCLIQHGTISLAWPLPSATCTGFMGFIYMWIQDQISLGQKFAYRQLVPAYSSQQTFHTKSRVNWSCFICRSCGSLIICSLQNVNSVPQAIDLEIRGGAENKTMFWILRIISWGHLYQNNFKQIYILPKVMA